MIRVDLGAGDASPPGFVPMGRDHGSEIYPLPHADGTVEEIRASHVLEHVPHGQIETVLADWVRALRPGGRLRIAVPDFGKIAERYVAGEALNVQGYLMGGQSDENDYHKALFDERELKRRMAAAGLVLLRRWESEIDDCAALPISLNLEGTKPHAREIKVSACMSVPRLGFMDNFFSAIEAFPRLGIPLRRYQGAFWGACLTRVIEETIAEDDPDAILTLDYDTVFTPKSVATLLELALAHPEADAIAPLQAGRGDLRTLFTMRGEDGGANQTSVPREVFASDLTPITTAHFGLTLIRTAALRDLPKPWFAGKPDPQGGWGDGRVDDDIWFWRQFEAAGKRLYLANRVVVGHMELMVRWPGRSLDALWQPVSEWRERGAPEEAWR